MKTFFEWLVVIWTGHATSTFMNCNLPLPANFACTEVFCESATFSWCAVPGAANYVLLFRHVAGNTVAPWQMIDVHLDTTYQMNYAVNNLTPGELYEFALQLECGNVISSKSGISETVTITAPFPCALPVNISSIADSVSATVSWTASCNQQQTWMRYREVGETQWIMVMATGETYTFLDLPPNITYEYNINACDTANSLLWSDIKTFTIGEPAFQPNIIVIVCDDLTNKITGTTGAPSFVHTPNIDQVALNGVSFSRNYCATPLCAPSRATLITGEYAVSTGVSSNSTQPNFNMALPTLGAKLKQAGYKTAAVGKFHEVIGAHGADDWNYSLESTVNQGAALIKFSLNGGIPKNAGNDSIITKVLLDTAIALVNKNALESQPLCLILLPRDPHTPKKLAVEDDNYYEDDLIIFGENTQHYTDLYPSFMYDLPNKYYRDEEQMDSLLRDQYKVMTYLDSRIGELFAAVATNGKPTMIIFTSDNGFLNTEHGLYGKKWTLKESVEVPLMIWYDAWFPAGETSNLLTGNMDLYATILHAAGVTDTWSDGLSIKDLYDGKVKRPFAYSTMAYTTDDNASELASSRAVWDLNFKLIQYGCSSITEQFFDLQNDVQETSNLINQPALQPLIQTYREAMSTRAAFFGDTLPGTLLNCFVVQNEKAAGKPPIKKDSISIYPNPAVAMVTIRGMEEEGVAAVFTALGKPAGYFKGNTFDTSLLPEGIYFVKISMGDGKIIIEKLIRQ
ncbi:MAG: sulfatase-like hydrolase/transferase [Chitinophagales bacterium]